MCIICRIINCVITGNDPGCESLAPPNPTEVRMTDMTEWEGGSITSRHTALILMFIFHIQVSTPYFGIKVLVCAFVPYVDLNIMFALIVISYSLHSVSWIFCNNSICGGLKFKFQKFAQILCSSIVGLIQPNGGT